ncbi:MAG: choice-of-anchor K domain-containing protein [Nostoc sp.]|uniref:choice-of-anchor K domain-containing protein n=1 Tax=Nostoc sp. TaxID=1180 RepID=UPI002FFD26B1
MFQLNLSVSNVLSTIVVTVTAVSWSYQAQAITIAGSSSGTWINPEAGAENPNAVFSGFGNVFQWGAPNGFGTGSNELSFSGNSFSTSNDSLVKLGDLTYFNGITLTGTLIDSVSLNTLISVTIPSLLDQNFTSKVKLSTTLNTGVLDLDADSIFLPNRFPSPTFNLDGTLTRLEIVGFSKDGGATTFSQLRVFEGKSDRASLYAKFVTIPEPSYTGLHMLAFSSLGGAYVLKRKLRRQKLVTNKG